MSMAFSRWSWDRAVVSASNHFPQFADGSIFQLPFFFLQAVSSKLFRKIHCVIHFCTTTTWRIQMMCMWCERVWKPPLPFQKRKHWNSLDHDIIRNHCQTASICRTWQMSIGNVLVSGEIQFDASSDGSIWHFIESHVIFSALTVKQYTMTIYHMSCTNQMGPASNPWAVVDPQLRVYGVSGLRVIDASVSKYQIVCRKLWNDNKIFILFPFIFSANHTER